MSILGILGQNIHVLPSYTEVYLFTNSFRNTQNFFGNNFDVVHWHPRQEYSLFRQLPLSIFAVL